MRMQSPSCLLLLPLPAAQTWYQRRYRVQGRGIYPCRKLYLYAEGNVCVTVLALSRSQIKGHNYTTMVTIQASTVLLVQPGQHITCNVGP